MKTQTTITTQQDSQALARLNHIMTQAGQAANEAGARVAFADHTARKADNTIRRKRADLLLFQILKLNNHVLTLESEPIDLAAALFREVGKIMSKA